MILNDLLIKIGVKADLKKLQDIEVGLKNVGKATILLGGAFAGMMAGLTAFVNSNLTALDEVRQLSKVTGEAADKIHLLGKVAEVNGSSSQAAQASIEGLSKAIGEAANGVGLGAKAFEKYGFSAKKANGEIKSSSEMFEEIRQRMVGMSNQQQIAMLSKLGIDGSMIQTLRLTNAEMQEAMQTAEALSLGVANAENVEIAAGFKDSMTEMGQMLTGVREFLSLQFAPSIQDVIARFKNWFIVNNAFIKDGLTSFARIIQRVMSFIGDFVSAIDRIIRSTVGWKNAMMILATVSLWANRQMIKAFAMNPFVWIVAGLVALIALVEDFIIYLEDGEAASYLGAFWEPFAKGLRWVQGLIADFPRYLESAVAFWNEYRDEILLGIGLIVALFGRGMVSMSGQFMGFVRAFSAIGKISGVFSSFIGLGGKLITKIKAIGIAIRMAFTANPVGAMIAVVALLAYVIYKNIDKIKKYFSDGWQAIKARWQSFLDEFSVNPISAIFNLVVDYIKLPFKVAFDAVIGLWNFFTGSQLDLQQIEQGFAQVTDWIMSPFKSAFDWVKLQYDTYIAPIIDAVKNFSPSKIADGISDKAKGAWDSVTSFFGGDNNAEKVANISMQAMSLPAQALTTNNADHSMQNSNNKYTTTINLNGSGYADKDAKLIADRYNQTIQNTRSAFVQ
ncbi:phage tail tape measure protein [Histophilus somni]|uniref:phage tail tape measure protein n=1 Tax=Histophilus somni TaxID=731 RepID=UPI00201F11BE|nr:phage tail tape measure protein [Histophilus somni]